MPSFFTIDVATASVGLSSAPSAIARYTSISGMTSRKKIAEHGGADQHEQDRQARDRAEVAAELDRRQRHRRRVQQRGQHPDEDDLGVDLERREERQQAHADPDRDERERTRDADARRERGRQGDHHDPDDRDEQEVHRGYSTPSVRTASRSATSSSTDASMRARARGVELEPLDHAVAGAVRCDGERADQAFGHAVLAARDDRRRGPAHVPDCSSRTCSIAALAADATDDEPRTSMISAPRFATRGMKTSSSQASAASRPPSRAARASATRSPRTVACETSGNCVAEWLPQIATPLDLVGPAPRAPRRADRARGCGRGA